MHLMIDGFDCDSHLLSDAAVAQHFLKELPHTIGMKRISPIQVVSLPNGDNPFHGVSGIVMIAQSHLALHTWPERRFICLDIFSCKAFDSEAVVRAAMRAFGIGRTRTKLLELRGGGYG